MLMSKHSFPGATPRVPCELVTRPLQAHDKKPSPTSAQAIDVEMARAFMMLASVPPMQRRFRSLGARAEGHSLFSQRGLDAGGRLS